MLISNRRTQRSLLLSLFNELKRRNVFRVGVAYIVVAWLVAQVLQLVFESFGTPEWVMKTVLVLLAAGLPFALFFAWAFEMTPEGLKRESEVDRAQSITPQTGKKLNTLIFAVMALAIAYFSYDKFVLTAGRDAALVEAAKQTVSEQVAMGDAPAQTDNSIAVLPFVNMSDDAGNEYFSDGLSEELLNLLAKVPELRVAARTSSFSLKGKEIQIAEVGEILKVAHVLEGSVRKSGNRVRITAQLIKADDGYHLWSETFDREMDDVFAIQDEIALKVVEALKVTLFGEAPSVGETNPAAYALVLQARHFQHQRSADSLERAEALYKQAIEEVPDYAAAWTGLSGVYREQAGNGLRPIAEGYQLASKAADQAIAIDPEYAPGHAARGEIALLRNDPRTAAVQLQKALELDPANTDIITNAAKLVEMLDAPDKAIALLQFVIERDPVNADGHAGLGRSFRVSGRWDEAIEAYQTSLALSPARYGSYQGIGEALLFKGEAEKALETYALEPDEEWRTKGMAMAYHTLGRHEEFEAAFTELRDKWGKDWPSEIAHVYNWIGDKDAAFEWLNKAVDQNEDGLNQQYYQPLLRSLHDDPRWSAFRARTIGSAEALREIAFEVELPKSN
jgi:adenylate cyclase